VVHDRLRQRDEGCVLPALAFERLARLGQRFPPKLSLGLHLVPGLAVEGRGEMRLDQHHPERLIAPPPTGLYPPSALRGFLKLRLHRRRRFKPVERAHVSPAQQGPKRRGPKERENPAGRAPAPLPLPAPPRGK